MRIPGKLGAILQAIAMCLSLVFVAPTASAQRTSGTILGSVLDQAGAKIPGAKVTVTSVETGAEHTVAADSRGEYEVPGLPNGAYTMKATAQGFSTEERTGVDLTVGATLTVNMTLRPGTVSETVVVTDQAPQVDTSTATLGGTVGETEIRELPLNGRDWLQLATLQAGVVGGLGQQSTQGSPTNSRAARGNGENLYISGNRPTENLYLVDGLIVNDYANGSPGSGLNVNLGVDAIREFAVLTSGFSAQYGMTSGGVVNAAFRSGANSFHGTAFGFFRNSALDASNYFDNGSKPPFHRYQYGAGLGGPIMKDKFFFFGNFERLTQSRSLSEQSLTLSDSARTGVVPNPAYPKNPNAPPTITVPISPLTQPFFAFFPVANGKDNGDGTAFYNFAGLEIGDENYAVGKLDYILSQKTTLSASYQFDTASLSSPDLFNEKLTGSPSNHHNVSVSMQHQFSPNLLNTARIGVSHTYASDSEDTAALQPVATNTSLGYITGLPAGVLTAGALATAGGLGASGADVFHFITYQASDDLSWVRGRHTFQFGYSYDQIRDNFSSVNLPLGLWDFGSVSDFLQDIPQDFQSDFPGTNGSRSLRSDVNGAYAQDVFRISPKLTLTAGVRYETSTPTTEKNGKISTLLNLTDAKPQLGGSFTGSQSRLNFAPRVGVAWDPYGNGKTAVRASFGIYDILPMPYLFVNRTHGVPFYVTGTVTAPPGSAFPNNGLSLLTPSSTEVIFVQQHPPRSYNQAWNLTVQQQITADLALTLGYVGSHSVHVPLNIDDMDQVPLSLTTRNANGNYVFPIPANGKPQRINPNYGRIEGMTWNDYSSYNGLQSNLSKRFSKGFAAQVTYSWSKSLDEGSATFSDNEYDNTVGPSYVFDLSLQKGPSDYDITNNVVINGQWDIPVSSRFTGASKVLLGGWQLGGIFQEHTGEPFSVRITSDQAFTGNSRTKSSAGGQRPNYNPAPGCTTNAINPGQPKNYIKTQCFSFPAPGVLGNLGRNTLRGPRLEDFDSSLFKNISVLHDKYSLQLRAEAFNVLNHANFRTQATGLFNKSGGINVSNTALPAPTLTTSRQIQFGAKFVF